MQPGEILFCLREKGWGNIYSNRCGISNEKYSTPMAQHCEIGVAEHREHLQRHMFCGQEGRCYSVVSNLMSISGTFCVTRSVSTSLLRSYHVSNQSEFTFGKVTNLE